MQRTLNYAWYNSAGKDISDVIRGKIQMLDEILEMKSIFDRFDKLAKTVNEKKGAN